jgi:multidrug resistance efflux pump
MARKYKIEGTRDYLYWAIGMMALCLWAVRDAWYPPPSVLEKHPLEKTASFKTDGVVEEVFCVPGRSVNEGQVLARLRKPDLDPLIREAEAAQVRLREAGDPEPPDLRSALDSAANALKEARDRTAAAELVAPVSGTVLSVETKRLANLSAGDPVVRIKPRDSFYVFNKSLAIFAFLGALTCAILHRLSQ